MILNLSFPIWNEQNEKTNFEKITYYLADQLGLILSSLLGTLIQYPWLKYKQQQQHIIFHFVKILKADFNSFLSNFIEKNCQIIQNIIKLNYI